MVSEWRALAACSPATAHLFEVAAMSFGPTQFLSADNVRAVAICQACPVRQLCLEDAVGRFEDPIIAGGQLVWGGRVWEASTLRAEIEELDRAGLTDRQIAAHTGVHIRTVQRHLRWIRVAALAEAA